MNNVADDVIAGAIDALRNGTTGVLENFLAHPVFECQDVKKRFTSAVVKCMLEGSFHHRSIAVIRERMHILDADLVRTDMFVAAYSTNFYNLPSFIDSHYEVPKKYAAIAAVKVSASDRIKKYLIHYYRLKRMHMVDPAVMKACIENGSVLGLRYICNKFSISGDDFDLETIMKIAKEVGVKDDSKMAGALEVLFG